MNHLHETSSLSTRPEYSETPSGYGRSPTDADRGLRISSARRAKRWNRTQLSNLCFLTPAEMKALEAGGDAPMNTFRHVASALDKPLLWILIGRQSAEPRDEQQIMTGTTGPDLAESLSIHATGDATIQMLADEIEALRREQADLDYQITQTPPSDRRASGLLVLHNKASDRQHDIIERLPDLEATMQESIDAKMRALRPALPLALLSADRVSTEEHKAAWSIVRDLPVVFASMEARSDEQSNPAILNACAEYQALETGYNRLYYGPHVIEDDKERNAFDEASGRVARQSELMDLVAHTPATTLEELRARARCALASSLDLAHDEDHPVGEIGNSIIRDLVGDYDPIAEAKGEMVAPRTVGSKSATNPDAALIAICEAARQLEEQSLAIYYGPDAVEDEKEQDRLSTETDKRIKPQQKPLLEEVTKGQASTLEGLQAKARLYATYDPKLFHLTDGGTFDDLVMSIIRDLISDYDPVAVLQGRAAETKTVEADPVLDLATAWLQAEAGAATYPDFKSAEPFEIERDLLWDRLIDATPTTLGGAFALLSHALSETYTDIAGGFGGPQYIRNFTRLRLASSRALKVISRLSGLGFDEVISDYWGDHISRDKPTEVEQAEIFVDELLRTGATRICLQAPKKLVAIYTDETHPNASKAYDIVRRDRAFTREHLLNAVRERASENYDIDLDDEQKAIFLSVAGAKAVAAEALG